MCMEPSRILEGMSRHYFRRAKQTMWSFRKYPTDTARRRRQLKANMVKAAVRKYQRADARPERFVSCYRKAELGGRSAFSGIRAPENTTQYLINIAYQDMLNNGELPFPAEFLEETDSHLAFHRRGSPHTADRACENARSPVSVYTSEDRDCETTWCLGSASTSEEHAYEASLEFQQRDFELMYRL